ncbi:hypothetical protein QJQ45_020757 [Haematococcus lacustris]|nr:hypothetical protein QJQ45_020757 [Haematococcus lacustris]
MATAVEREDITSASTKRQEPDKWTRLGNLLLAPSLQAQPPGQIPGCVLRLVLVLTTDMLRSSNSESQITYRIEKGGARDFFEGKELCLHDGRPAGGGAAALELDTKSQGQDKEAGQGAVREAPCPSPGPSELYEFSLPDLVIHDPLAPQAWLGLKGDLLLRCPSSGLTAALVLAEDGAVEGQLEQRQPGSRLGRGSKRAGLGTQRSAGVVAVGAGRGQGGAGKSGHSLTVLDNIAAGSGAAAGRLLPHADLAQLGPMQLPRLWSCLVDSLMYNSPLDAEGKVGSGAARGSGAVGCEGSEQLAGWLAHHFNGFPLGSEDPGGAPGGLAAPQPGAVQGGHPFLSPAPPTPAAAVLRPLQLSLGAGPEASDEEEVGAAPGTIPEAAGGGPEAAALALAAQDKRRLPPCCKVRLHSTQTRLSSSPDLMRADVVNAGKAGARPSFVVPATAQAAAVTSCGRASRLGPAALGPAAGLGVTPWGDAMGRRHGATP